MAWQNPKFDLSDTNLKINNGYLKDGARQRCAQDF